MNITPQNIPNDMIARSIKIRTIHRTGKRTIGTAFLAFTLPKMIKGMKRRLGRMMLRQKFLGSLESYAQ